MVLRAASVGKTEWRMMLAIKIQCGCGQKYSFEVEPAGGRMPHTVACPICGADGTSAANQALSQNLPAQSAPAMAPAIAAAGGWRANAAASGAAPVAVAPPPPPPPAPVTSGVRLHDAPTTAHVPDAVRNNVARIGQVDRKQAEHEARAKILWGDPVNDVVRYLMMQGFTAQEAQPLVNTLFEERAATIRKNGFRKILFGVPMICVPVVVWFVLSGVGYVDFKFLGAAVMVGLYGAYLFIKGCIMSISPKTEPGDVSSQ